MSWVRLNRVGSDRVGLGQVGLGWDGLYCVRFGRVVWVKPSKIRLGEVVPISVPLTFLSAPRFPSTRRGQSNYTHQQWTTTADTGQATASTLVYTGTPGELCVPLRTRVYHYYGPDSERTRYWGLTAHHYLTQGGLAGGHPRFPATLLCKVQGRGSYCQHRGSVSGCNEGVNVMLMYIYHILEYCGLLEFYQA